MKSTVIQYKTIEVETTPGISVWDITPQIKQILLDSKISDSFVNVISLHTTTDRMHLIPTLACCPLYFVQVWLPSHTLASIHWCSSSLSVAHTFKLMCVLEWLEGVGGERESQ